MATIDNLELPVLQDIVSIARQPYLLRMQKHGVDLYLYFNSGLTHAPIISFISMFMKGNKSFF